MRPARAALWPLLMSLALSVGLAACSSTAARYDQRMEDTYAFIDQWESALKGGAEDRGWSMLSQASRRGFDSEDQYVELAAAADWSDLEITPLAGYCDDLHACSINLLIAGGIDSVPKMLLKSPNDNEADAYRLLHFNDFDQDGHAGEVDPEVGNAQIQVWWERVPWADPGIGGGGG